MNTKKILIELPISVYEQVQRLAQAEDRSVRYTIRKLVERGVENVQE